MPPTPELLARFLVERHFSKQKLLVKPGAFLPEFYQGTFVTSAFDIDGLSDADAWIIGETHVAAPRAKALHGHAEFRNVDLADIGLEFKSHEPPPRHGDVVGWSEEKETRISAAQELAARSTLKLKP